ncbi:MAG: Na+:solute symporter [Bacteroidetes bacterium]|nr:Na+:solute symporter [Bacteroidota bacterium]MBL7104740.1 Na+:solute symporter [Bacteroidales bacterium]
MILSTIDWIIVGVFFVIVLFIGWIASKTAGKDTSQFFLGGRGMPWWLLGISMVACTFSADTPNLVTGMVRESGVAKNWAWWAFLITGMVTVFVYAKLWRRTNALTDLEYYEKRYSGKAASFLRGFRSIYLGIFFNMLIMGTVTLAAIKIGGVLLGIEPWVVVIGASVVVVLYAGLGGLKGVIWADFFQYSVAMFGAVLAAVVAVRQPEVGGLKGLLSNPALQDKLSFFPDLSDPSVYIPLLIIPVAVQWWNVWYPGAEPGGGGYIAQRMLSAKNEKNAIGATLLFNFAHYALRPWPWIIVALASLIIYPDLASIKAHFPDISDTYLKDDIAYPVMMSKLGPGWLGLVVASLIAAYMSTIGTHLNWGSSYVVNDFYKRFIKPAASEKELVAMGRITTVVLMVMAGLLSLLFLQDATQAFDIILLTGAGSGLIYLLRWFWWRINAWTEVVAMFVATVTALILIFGVDNLGLAESVSSIYPLPENYHLIGEKALAGTVFPVKLIIAIVITTISWILATYLTKPESKETLRSFYRLTRPGGPGWKKVILEARADGDFIDEQDAGKKWEMPVQILCVFIGIIVIYTSLFSIGSFVYGEMLRGIILLLVAIAGTIFLFKSFGKLRAD